MSRSRSRRPYSRLPRSRRSEPRRAQAPSSQSGQPAATFQLPTLIVTAQKEAAEAQDLPVSLTTVAQPTLRDTGASIVSDLFAPNVYFTEFTARKLSNPRFRGIGASPANPAVATYFDGVPQLNTNSSSIDLLDVGQVEFVRGPQSALFGRNSIGGLINVTSAQAVALWLDRQPLGAVREPVVPRSARQRRRARRGRQGRRGGGDAVRTARRLHGERPHRQRPRLAIGVLREGSGAVHALIQLGDARDSQRRAGARRRLRAERPGRSAQPTPSTPRATSRATRIATSSGRPS